MELEAIKESANAETKSSMGDKYETGREMMMQERNRLGSQLELAAEQLAAFNSIDPEKQYSEVKYGCVVLTESALFFLSAAIGKATVSNQLVFAISGEAPIAKAMLGRKANDSFTFNKKKYTIKEVA